MWEDRRGENGRVASSAVGSLKKQASRPAYWDQLRRRYQRQSTTTLQPQLKTIRRFSCRRNSYVPQYCAQSTSSAPSATSAASASCTRPPSARPRVLPPRPMQPRPRNSPRRTFVAPTERAAALPDALALGTLRMSDSVLDRKFQPLIDDLVN